MRLEQWSNIRNAVKEQRNAVARDLDKMEASGISYDEIVSNYPRYDQAVKLFVDYEEIVNHMDLKVSAYEIEQIDY